MKCNTHDSAIHTHINWARETRTVTFIMCVMNTILSIELRICSEHSCDAVAFIAYSFVYTRFQSKTFQNSIYSFSIFISIALNVSRLQCSHLRIAVNFPFWKASNEKSNWNMWVHEIHSFQFTAIQIMFHSWAI